MKPTFRHLISSAAVMALLVSGGNALAQQTGIAATKHNLSSSNQRTDENRTTDIADICVFCHTPHGSDTGAAAPLWNRNVSANLPTYQTYDQLGTVTLDGNILGVGSVSLACLSCHDGTQALDNVLNQPGSGGFNAAPGARMGGTWAGPRVNTAAGADQGKLKSGFIANLGTDLRNDHPVGIIYGGFRGRTDANQNTIIIDPDFKLPSTNGSGVWWVDTEATADNVRDKTDMQLYTRNTTGDAQNVVNEPYVECASCHDPHVENATFLRIANTGSAVCLACHTK